MKRFLEIMKLESVESFSSYDFLLNFFFFDELIDLHGIRKKKPQKKSTVKKAPP